MACADGANLFFSSAAEHFSRRFLQCQQAVKKSPKSPDFEGLDEYMDHTRGAGGVIVAAKFEEVIAARLKSKAMIMKQMRLNREEKGHDEKRKDKNQPNAKAKAKGKGKAGAADGTDE